MATESAMKAVEPLYTMLQAFLTQQQNASFQPSVGGPRRNTRASAPPTGLQTPGPETPGPDSEAAMSVDGDGSEGDDEGDGGGGGADEMLCSHCKHRPVVSKNKGKLSGSRSAAQNLFNVSIQLGPN